MNFIRMLSGFFAKKKFNFKSLFKKIVQTKENHRTYQFVCVTQ